RRRHTRFSRDWSSDVCSSDLSPDAPRRPPAPVRLFASTCVLSAGGGPDDARDLEWVAAINLERLGVVVVLDGSRLLKWVAVDGRSEERRVGKERGRGRVAER